MPSTQLTLILVAALIAPAYSSLPFVTKKTYSAAGCAAATLIGDAMEMDEGPSDGTCGMTAGETEDATGSDTGVYETFYEKVTCADNTATNGYTVAEFSDSACTVAKTTLPLRPQTKTTGGCTLEAVGSNEYEQYGCGSTSDTVGAVKYGMYSTADCADASFQSAGYFAVNFCQMSTSGGAWISSSKAVIENAKIQTYTYSTVQDCSSAGVAQPLQIYTLDACTAHPSQPGQWLKLGKMIDGSSIDGAGTVPTGNTATSAAISVFLGVVCTVLNLMFC